MTSSPTKPCFPPHILGFSTITLAPVHPFLTISKGKNNPSARRRNGFVAVWLFPLRAMQKKKIDLFGSSLRLLRVSRGSL